MTTQDQINQAITALTPIAQKLSTSSQTVFGWAVRNVIVTGVVELIFSVLFFVICLFMFICWDEESPDITAFAILLFFGLSLVLFIISIQNIASPNYAALQSIISTIKGN